MQLLIPAKTLQCPAHMCGTLCTHLATRLTPPLATAGWCFKHTCMFVSPTTVQRGNRKNIPECAALILWKELELTRSCLQWDSRNTWRSKLGSAQALDTLRYLAEQKRDRGLGSRKAEIWGLCRNEDKLLLGIPHPQHSLPLNKLIVHGKVPWNVGLRLWNV